MSKLKAVDPKKAEPSKPKMLIFGKPGVGKTWTSLDFPACYYIDTEGGADLEHYTDKLKKAGGMYLGPDQGSLSFDTVLEQVQALATEKHQFKTLIIDSFSKLFNSAVADESESLGDKDVFGASKKPAIARTRRLVNWLNRLDMNVILVAHEKDVWGKDDKGQPTVTGQTFDAWDKLEYELHLCLQIFKQGASRKARVRKSRLTGFPDAEAFEWSYAEFAKRYGKDIMEQEAKTITLGTEDQLKELNYLLDLVKLPEGETEKWLKKANVDSFAEMDSDKVQACINALKAKTQSPKAA